MNTIKFTGLNIGGFLSQVEDFSLTSVKQFVTKQDFQKIRSWGFNTIRLPVDFPFLFTLSLETPLRITPIEINFVFLDTVIGWAEELGLNIILDLHKAPGHSFDPNELQGNQIWQEGSKFQKIFLDIWDFLAHRYSSQKHVIFETLNEPVAPTGAIWNRLMEITIERIRQSAPSNWIVIESNLWGTCKTFPVLQKFKDEKIIYSFHFYEPMPVTHQKAEWIAFTRDYYNDFVHYPGKFDNLDKSIEIGKNSTTPGIIDMYRESKGLWNENRLEKQMQPVFEFQRKYQVPILCGEFGCIAYAKPETRQNWLKDLMTILQKHDISFTYWTYKNMHFGIYDYTAIFETNPNYDETRLDGSTLQILREFS